MALVQVADVAAWLDVDVGEINAAQCQLAIDAVEARLPKHFDVPADWYTDAAHADFKLGVIMAIAKLRRRGASPTGQIGFDGTSTIAFYDGDIAAQFADYEKRAGRFG